MIRRFSAVVLVLLFLPALVFGESTPIRPAANAMLSAKTVTSPKEHGKKTEADIFMDSLSDIMHDELVRSVLSEKDETILARMLWGEDRENPLFMRAAVLWCVFNRMDVSHKSIRQIVTHDQFCGYNPGNPVTDWAVSLVRDVAVRYVLEQNGFEDVGRVLPREYLYYERPDGKRYHVFKTKLKVTDKDNKIWDWSLPSPYSE